MEQIRNSIAGVANTVLGTGTTQSTEEPPSGTTGKGTTEEPYDQGNAPETASGPGIEPPSGQTGKGSLEEPYDQGNAPESATASNPVIEDVKPASKPQGSGLRPDELSKPQETADSAPASKTYQGSGLRPDEISKTADTATSETTEKSDAPQTSYSPTTTSTTEKDAGRQATRKFSEDRDISPGTKPDGTHAQTSGDRGETYEPGALNKLKGKLHIGKH